VRIGELLQLAVDCVGLRNLSPTCDDSVNCRLMNNITVDQADRVQKSRHAKGPLGITAIRIRSR